MDGEAEPSNGAGAGEKMRPPPPKRYRRSEVDDDVQAGLQVDGDEE